MIIILTTLSLILGILAGYYLNPSPALSAILTSLCTLCFAFTYIKSSKHFIQKPYFAACSFLLAFCTGMLSYTLHYAPNQKLHYTNLLYSKNQTIEGVVSERLKPNDYSEKYIVKIISIGGKPAIGKVLAYSLKKEHHTPMRAGDRIYTSAKLTSIPKPLNPNTFDYAEYLAFQNIYHQLSLDKNYIISGQVKNFDYYTETLRSKLLNSFSIHNFNKTTTGIINALLLGQRQEMDYETSKNYTNAGVIHILAISGLHIAVLYYILTLFLKPILRLKKGRLLHFFIIISFLWLFAVLSGLSASVVRSVVMFSFISFGIYINRNASIYNSIAISLFVLLLANPNWLFDAGFQLSYFAVIAIVATQPLYRQIKVSKYKAINYFAEITLISFVAQIGVLPLSLYYFNQFPLLFLAANCIVIPLSNCILVLGISVLAFNFVSITIAVTFGRILSGMIQAMNTFIEWIASFDMLIIKNISFTLLFAITLYIIIITLLLWLYKKSFLHIAALLSTIILFQAVYSITIWNTKTKSEMIVFNNSYNTLISIKERNNIVVLSNDSLAFQNKKITDYRRGSFNNRLSVKPLKNILWLNNKSILIIDSTSVYSNNKKPDILILTQSPKINLERVLMHLTPKQVVADASNYKKHIKLWKESCLKANIPFHATQEKGYFKID